MRYRVAPLLALFFVIPIYGQHRGSGIGSGSIQVHVTFTNSRHAGINLQVVLMEGSSNTPVATYTTNDMGVVEFGHIPVGEYHVVVSGDNIETTDSGIFEVDERKLAQSEEVAVRQKSTAADAAVPGAAPTVSAADLKVPDKARHEFDNANGAMMHQHWQKAVEHLQKAIGIDPTYASAYNNLGAVYARLKDEAHERQALEKALSLDDHLYQAMVNLAKLDIRLNDYVHAQPLLERAMAVDPTDPHSLMLLAYAQFFNQHYDAAIANVQKINAMPHDNMAFAHYIAARAYEHENRLQSAVAELQAFLKEEPAGARADHIRDEIRLLQRSQQ